MEIKLSLTEELRPYKHNHLGSFYMIGYGPILIQFSMDRFHTLHTYKTGAYQGAVRSDLRR